MVVIVSSAVSLTQTQRHLGREPSDRTIVSIGLVGRHAGAVFS